MNTSFRLLAAAALLAFTACGSGSDEVQPPATASAGPIPAGATMPADHPPIGELPQDQPGNATAPQPGSAPAAAGETRMGTVIETMNAGGYTYALLDMEEGEMWAAGPETEIAEGDEVTIAGMMGLTNFYARSLDRTFEQILFVAGFRKS